ncbi:MAG TPA: NADH-quinone oxidoreductase subunit N, partial [Bacteroidales bacterium]|nr:NADH-quinone oxidoreductase subunit N [Bacteroidales bacterium]
MTATDFYYLTPFLITAIAPVVIMITIALVRNFRIIYSFSLLAFFLALISFAVMPISDYSGQFILPHEISSLFIIDGYTMILGSITILCALTITYFSRNYLLYQESQKEEYFIVLFVAVLGALLLIAASNFISLFLGLETLSISLYILVSYRRARHKSLEAGVKYLVLASVASAFLLFGMGLIYAHLGTLDFSAFANVSADAFNNMLFVTGFAMMMVGLGFKLALVPFHMWTPDVYEGAPVPVATFISTVSKGSVIAVVLRFFYAIDGFNNQNFIIIVSVLAIFSMFLGNLLAIRQQNIKRILAYSSISNMGYLVVTLLIGGPQGISSAIFYIMTYFVTLLAAFGVITLFSRRDIEA